MTTKLSKIFSTAGRLASATRYSQSRMVNDESVLEHTGFVCLSCYIFYNNLLSEGFELDIGDLMSKAVVHDIEEVVTGDIPRPTKYSSIESVQIIEKISLSAIREISSSIRLSELESDWVSSKSGSEGKVVKLCDHLAVLYKTYDEVVLRGNKTVAFHNSLAIDSIRENVFYMLDDEFAGSHFLQSILKDAIIMSEQITKTGKLT